MKTLLLPIVLWAVTAASTLLAQTQSWSYSSSSTSSSSFDNPREMSSQMMQSTVPGINHASFSGRGENFSASYRNSSAVEVVRQLAGLAGIDPQLSKSSLEVLESAEPVTRQFSNVTPRKALNEVLADLNLKVIESEGELLLATEREAKGKIKPLDVSLRGMGVADELARPLPLMAFQTPLRLFLQSASMRLGVELQVDYEKLKVNPQTPVSIQPFSSRTLGESLQAGLASAGLEYRFDGAKLLINRRGD